MEELADDLAFGVVALRNRAERKQAEQQLTLLNFALNNINEEAILVDEQARISYVNDAACRGLKYSHDELLTKTIPDIDPLFSLEKWPETWANIQECGSLTFEGLHRVSDHSEYPVGVSASYFDYENRGYILALSRDITERKRTEQEMLRINRFLRTLSRCNETLVHTQDEQSLLQEMCRVVVEVGEFVLAWVGFSDDSHTLRIQAQFGGVVEGYVNRSTLIDGTAADQTCRPAIRALQSGEIEVVHNSATDPCLPWRTQALEFGYNSAIALPLLNGDKVFGVFAIYSSERESFGSEESTLLSELASDLSYGIQALRTRIDREHFVSQLQGSMESTIQALASTVDLRDPYTAGHQRRVAHLAAAIARAAGFTEERVQVIFLAGLIHDIGKIAIPAEILSKPGRLSETEMALARTHVTASYDILKNIDFPWPIARIVRQHHERMDGSGYPDGLKGNEILQEARILIVADVVEAMNTHRPYRPAHSIDEALEELQNGRGIVYDADIVDLCIKLFREEGYVLE
jgi:PAS domain S-box-containing protein/putative nucleotidyltransferase with HDIG domain